MVRITKKEIYRQHGIVYNDGKILYNGKWIRELLKKGNSKTGEKVYTFSLPAGTEGSCVCDCEGCYAKTGFYTKENVKKSLALNLEIVNNDIEFFYNAVSAQLECLYNSGITEIRIHASGDFNTKNPVVYALAWKNLVIEHSNMLFWTYTKMQQFESLFDYLKNGNIVKSVIDGVGYNFGHCDYILETYKTLKEYGASVYICKCGFDKNQHCENCGHCGKAQFVLFLEHSTDYEGEKDPLYNELKTLVMSQESIEKVA